MSESAFDQIFRDDKGDIAIAQPPNLPIIVGVTASFLRLIPSNAYISLGLDLVAFGALFTWAWLELFQGVNYFRRSLGFLTLMALLASKFLVLPV